MDILQVLHDQYNATANIYDGELNIIQYPFVIFHNTLKYNILIQFLLYQGGKMTGWGPGGPTTAYQDPGLRWAHHLDSGGQNIYAVSHFYPGYLRQCVDIFGSFHFWFSKLR